MKLLFQCTLLIIYFGSTNLSLYNKQRHNVKFLIPKKAEKLYRKAITRSVYQRNRADDDWGKIFDDIFKVAEDSNDDEVTDSTPKVLRIKKDSERYQSQNSDGENMFDSDSKVNEDTLVKFDLVEGKAKRTTPKLLWIQEESKERQSENNDGAYSAHKRITVPIHNFNEEDRKRDDLEDIKLAKSKARVLKNAHQFEHKLNDDNLPFKNANQLYGQQKYHMDPVLNYLRARDKRKWLDARRGGDDDDSYTSDGSTADSSEVEKEWKEQWKNYWNVKKFEALNTSMPPGDQVNMVAARPWGVQCGDPNQHDVPWGQCMLAMECEPEYRIYRGDFLCGRTEFVCCALMLSNYDQYQGIDVSFDDQSLSTDSDEKNRLNDKERKKRDRKRRRKKRRRDREKRKKNIRKNIRKIMRAIKKLLDSQYRNGTHQRRKKTKMLKKFVENLKKQYKKDRSAVKDLHEEQMMKIDAALMEKLKQIRSVNEEFMKNATFRDIIVNGTINRTGARMLVQAYPELIPYFVEGTRRHVALPSQLDGSRDFRSKSDSDYDVEYGYLYE